MPKILAILASLFMGKLMNTAKPASALVLEMVVAQSRTIVMIFVSALTFSFLLAGGLFLAVVGGVEWFDGTAASPHLFYSGLALSAVCILILANLFSKKNWVVSEQAKRMMEDKPPAAPHRTPVEDLIQLFVTEYTKETNRGPVAAHSASAPSAPVSPVPGSSTPSDVD